MRLDIERYLASRGVQVTAREIGEMLSNISSAAREQRQRAIAEAIAGLGLDDREGTKTGPRRTISAVRRIEAASAHTSADLSASQRLEDGLVAPSSASPPPVAPDSIRSDSTGMTTRRPKRSRLPLVVALVGVIAVGAFFGFGRYAAQRNEEANGVTAVAPVTTAHTLTIATRPSDARVFVDGSEVPGNPAVVKVPAGSEHSVRVEREGYEPSERSVKVSEQTSLSVDLVAKAEPSATPRESEKPRSNVRGPRVAAPVVAPRAPAPAPAEKNCDPPFYFVNGNKTYKPECI
jgi:hypothetical protein